MNLTAEHRAWFDDVRSQFFDRLKPQSTHLGRHVFDVGPPVPEAAVRNARLFGSRVGALAELPKGGIVAEVGTQAGWFAERVLDTARPRELHLFDLEFDTLRATRSEVAPARQGSAAPRRFLDRTRRTARRRL